MNRRKQRLLKRLLKPKIIDEYKLWAMWLFMDSGLVRISERNRRLILRRDAKWRTQMRQEAERFQSSIFKTAIKNVGWTGGYFKVPLGD